MNIMRKIIQSSLLILTVIAFVACSGTKELSTSPGAIQGDWQLSSMNGNQISNGSSYTLSFNTDMTVAGLAGCNYYVTGNYNAQEEGQISLDAVSSTDISCESKSTDDDFVNAVEAVNSFEVRQGNTLVLNPGSSSEVIFSRVVQNTEEG